jgi:hypothetical protein
VLNQIAARNPIRLPSRASEHHSERHRPEHENADRSAHPSAQPGRGNRLAHAHLVDSVEADPEGVDQNHRGGGVDRDSGRPASNAAEEVRVVVVSAIARTYGWPKT